MKPGRGQHASDLRWWCLLVLLALSACAGGGRGVPPQIVEFVAEPSSVAPGETVVLHWRVHQLNGGRLRLEELSEGEVEPESLGEVTAQSSTAVRVEETTTFRLVAAGPGGTSRAEAIVSVVEPPPDPPQIAGFRSVDDGGGVTLEWEVTGADEVTIEPPGIDVTDMAELHVDPCDTTEYTLLASNAGGSASESLTVELETSECLLFLIAGQSNATGFGTEVGDEFPVDGLTEEPEEGVMMLDFDLDWVLAREPTHEGRKHSFLLRFGKEVKHATGKRVFLVPASEPGSSLDSWDPDDSSNNFSWAMKRAAEASDSLGIPFAAVIWYQGESDTSNRDEREEFVAKTDEVLQAFRGRLEGEPDLIFAQLSKRLWTEELDEPGNVEKDHNLAYQIVRERQRLMQIGAVTAQVGNAEESQTDRPHYYMAVTHDLPMSDPKHLSAAGQRTLGTRIANLYLACIHNECDSPPGPRLERLSVETTPMGSTVLVDLSEAVNEPTSDPSTPPYDDYFAVFVDGSERTDFTVELGLDPSIIRLEFATPFPPGATVQVRYMPPQELDLYVASENVVKGVDDGLPLPAFGMPVEDLPCDDPDDGCDSIPGLRYPDW